MNKKNIPYITIILIAINVIIFILMELIGSTEDGTFMYNWGAMYSPDVFLNGQWYRLITSMFLHFGEDHLINNMFMLGILGYQVEKTYGRIKFTASYFVCGIAGNIVSGLVEMSNGDYTIGAGASGAIFGIFGILLVMIFKSRKKIGQVSAPRLILLFVLIVFGNMQEGVDLMAHM